ncbi:MAG: DUF3015 family protein [Terriglobales bacterium]
MLSTLALALGLSACTLKATLDTTSDGTTNFLSSTTPGAWFTSEGLVKDQHKVTAFTTLNFQNLKEDMARGQGEYLASLGTLLGVPADYQAEFSALAQAKYPFLVSSDRTTPGEMLARLSRELSGYPNLNKLGVKN